MSKARLVGRYLALSFLALGVSVARTHGADCTCPKYPAMQMIQGGQSVYVYYGIRYGEDCSHMTPVSIYSSSQLTPLPGNCGSGTTPNSASCTSNTTSRLATASQALQDHVPSADVKFLPGKCGKNDKPTIIAEDTKVKVDDVTDFYFQFKRLGDDNVKWAHAFIHKIKIKDTDPAAKKFKSIITAYAFECEEPDTGSDKIVRRDQDEVAEDIGSNSYLVSAGPYTVVLFTKEAD